MAGRHEMIERIAARRPLIHCITNYVAMDISANVLIAVGASPAMIHAREEVAGFSTIADALSVNIGTLDPTWLDAMVEAAEAAVQAGKPWVFDPVGAGATSLRREAVDRLLALRPTLVRGNASEILACVGQIGAGRGVDAGDGTEEAVEAARQLARLTGGMVAATGEVDIVTDGNVVARIEGGSPLLTQVTAMGCALSATCAAALAVEPSLAVVEDTLAAYGAAAERAADGAGGPGTFRARFLDALAAR